MQLALPRPLDWRLLRWAAYAGLLALVIVNLWLVSEQVRHIVATGLNSFDFGVLHAASRLDNPYDDPHYLWSPVATYPVWLLTGLGEPVWAALHFVALLPLGQLGLLVGLSWPFWFDMATGNVMIWVAVTAFLAVSGNRYATVGFLVMTLLMPRPLMLPLTVWLLWTQPWTRRWFAGLFVTHALAVLATGLGPAWIERLLHLPGVMENPHNLAPSRWIGYAWWPIGLLVGALALRDNRVGLASVAVQPYIFPQYLLMLLLEARRPR